MGQTCSAGPEGGPGRALQRAAFPSSGGFHTQPLGAAWSPSIPRWQSGDQQAHKEGVGDRRGENTQDLELGAVSQQGRTVLGDMGRPAESGRRAQLSLAPGHPVIGLSAARPKVGPVLLPQDLWVSGRNPGPYTLHSRMGQDARRAAGSRPGSQRIPRLTGVPVRGVRAHRLGTPPHPVPPEHLDRY